MGGSDRRLFTVERKNGTLRFAENGHGYFATVSVRNASWCGPLPKV
jgi:hypothetical protein